VGLWHYRVRATLPPLPAPNQRQVEITVTAKCVKSDIPMGIDCTKSQVLSTFK